MKIKELIILLEKHPNKNADVMINMNVINPDDDQYDIVSDIEIFRQDDFYEDHIELLIFPKNENKNLDDDELLEKDGWEVTSEYPLHIKQPETGSIATLNAAEAVINELRYANAVETQLDA